MRKNQSLPALSVPVASNGELTKHIKTLEQANKALSELVIVLKLCVMHFEGYNSDGTKRHDRHERLENCENIHGMARKTLFMFMGIAEFEKWQTSYKYRHYVTIEPNGREVTP